MNEIQKEEEIKILEEIENFVCIFFDIEKKDLLTGKRSREISRARMIAWYLMKRELPDITYARISKRYNHVNHSSVMSGIKTAKKHPILPYTIECTREYFLSQIH